MSTYATEFTAREIGFFLRKRISEYGAEDKSRESWTIAVQHSLHDYATGKGWKKAEVLPTPNFEEPKKGKRCPFLLDFVVWRRDFEGDREGAWIACESEWTLGHTSVIEDFHKLLSFRAPYKLMIYDGNVGPRRIEELHEEFRKTLSTFQWQIDDEIYIFLEFKNGEGIARIYTWLPIENGDLREQL